MTTTKNYNHQTIERKWQKYWEKEKVYKTSDRLTKKKYVLDMFPYPSGATMHVGHLEGYVGTDVYSRYLRMNGFRVLHPMGWDAFGLPAENYAIKTGIHPNKSTHSNIRTFKRQLVNVGLSYDWSREIDTSDPEYYKWTQWLFIQLFKKGLAYKKKAPVNWCPKDETVLANEQVIDGKCERCDTPVVQKELDQWFFKITAYADRLISGLEKLDWPEDVKTQQINWIGKSKGLNIEFNIEKIKAKITVWTKFWETIFGTTFLVIAPEHKVLSKLDIPKDYKKSVDKYIKESLSKSHEERSELKEKTGVFTGLCAINPVNNKKIPIWIADYVLTDVGTGAVMGVPAHDQRDFDFAKKYHLDIVQVVRYSDENINKKVANKELPYEGEGFLINSGKFNEMNAWSDGKKKMADWMIEEKFANWMTTYHLRDWLISRQRYWGCPIPMIYCTNCGWQPVPESSLPVLLPTDVDFLPHGKSPITTSKTFQRSVTCPKCDKKAVRETDTMDGFADNSWYFIRFADPRNNKEFASNTAIKTWLPVDTYVGGGHVVQHLLYSRFFWKVLFDQGLIDKSVGDEPFMQLRAPGWILGPDSRKMSKRWGNVITPDDIIPKFGADVLRLYEMFMGPFDVVKPFNLNGVEGMHRFVKRVWLLFHNYKSPQNPKELKNILHSTIKIVSEDIRVFHYNTAISTLMVFINYIKNKGADKESLKILCQLLAPFAPHISEELWQGVLGYKNSVHLSSWPKYNSNYLEVSNITIIIQIDGRLRSQLKVAKEVSEEEIKALALSDKKVQKWINGKKYKVIYVPGKIINFVLTH